MGGLHHQLHQNNQYPTLTPLPQLSTHLYNSSSLNAATSNNSSSSSVVDINQSNYHQSNFSNTLNQLIKTENGTHTNLAHALSSEMDKSPLDIKHRQLLTNCESR